MIPLENRVATNIEDLSAVEETVITVPQKVPSTDWKTDENLKKLLQELDGEQVWRKSTSLAAKLGVDGKTLHDYLVACPGVASRPSNKDDGVFLYALAKRLKEVEEEKVVDKKLGKVVSEQERYALSTLSLLHSNLDACLRKYGVDMHRQDKDILDHAMNALKELQTAVLLMARGTGADTNKLL